ncbi:unnamed protein product [Bursaphelenchus okinawaensis]|uniref:S phase cyclin A-associated protein in the endoplasmic reticulum N-terminal domain-containing protein n=1 Tax=Bursaphelenchus okinawaensis TaxID=465554 RepID=A0A811JWF2_9BILA|nr:unnamed protein product [Bursaphelenchus okinawaensis]CAG9086724.1 unnamed protein product [Bursaphelenchus okinawaensis]
MGVNLGQDVENEAKQWAEYVQLLKNTTDSMHEICAARRNVFGCQEALMYLTNAVRDFEALISTIKVETEWENLENRPQALAWEVKGVPNRKTKEVKINGKAEDLSNGISNKPNVLYSKNNKENQERFRVAQPKSAMDIPQTKSSMAKIAYSRQLLWQRHKKLLTEKLTVKRRQQRDVILRRKSMPVLGNKTNITQNMETNLESIHEEDRNTSDSCSMKTQVGYYSKSEPQGIVDLNMFEDDEWKALTEEEESLAHEEASLQKEIEDEESILIDDEIQNVVLDFSDLERSQGTRWKAVVDRWDINNETEVKTAETKYPQPGDTARLHQRLLSPLRKKKYDMDVMIERQQKAEEMRAVLRDRKAERLRELHLRVEEISRKRMDLIEKKRIHLERKMAKATENRQKNIDLVVKQAKDADQRVLEVNFINSLEAENVKFGFQMKELSREYRVQSLMDNKKGENINTVAGCSNETLKKPKDKPKNMKKKRQLKEKLTQPNLKTHRSSILTFLLKEQEAPSDTVSNIKWRCQCGTGTVMASNFDIFAHFVSKEHLIARKLNLMDIDYNILRSEVEQCIFECSIDEATNNNNVYKANNEEAKQALCLQLKNKEVSSSSRSTLISQLSQIMENLNKLDKSSDFFENEITEWKRAFRKRREAEKNRLAEDVRIEIQKGLKSLSTMDSERILTMDRFIAKMFNLMMALYATEQQKLDFVCSNGIVDTIFILCRVGTVQNDLKDGLLTIMCFMDSLWGTILKNVRKDAQLFERIQVFNELTIQCGISTVICKCISDTREDVDINNVVVTPMKMGSRFFQFLLQSSQKETINNAEVMNCLISTMYSSIVSAESLSVAVKQRLLMVDDFWNTFWTKESLEKQITKEMLEYPNIVLKMTFIFRTLLNHILSQELSPSLGLELRAICFGLAAMISVDQKHKVFCVLGQENSIVTILADLNSKIFQPPDLRYSILVTLIMIIDHNLKALELVKSRIDLSWFTGFLKRLQKKTRLDGVENLRFLPSELNLILSFLATP